MKSFFSKYIASGNPIIGFVRIVGLICVSLAFSGVAQAADESGSTKSSATTSTTSSVGHSIQTRAAADHLKKVSRKRLHDNYGKAVGVKSDNKIPRRDLHRYSGTSKRPVFGASRGKNRNGSMVTENSVNIKRMGENWRLDHSGKAHGGIKTPHLQKNGKTSAASTKDVRIARRFVERKDRDVKIMRAKFKRSFRTASGNQSTVKKRNKRRKK